MQKQDNPARQTGVDPLSSDTGSLPDCCLVVLTDTFYLPGTVRLLESFQRHNGSLLPCIALSDDLAALDDPILEKLCHRRELIDSDRYASLPIYKKSRSKRHARTFRKFEAFADYGFSRNLFIDSDILCLRPAPLLFAPCEAPLQAARDTGFRPTRGYRGSPEEINSGVLVIDQPLQGNATVDQLLRLAHEQPGRSGYDSGDQGILNKWIRQETIPLRLLPKNYNLIKKDYSDATHCDDCSLLHFAGRKPWLPLTTTSEKQAPLIELWHSQAARCRTSRHSETKPEECQRNSGPVHQG